MSQCDISQLIADAKCFDCLPSKQMGSIQTQLLCEIFESIGNIPSNNDVNIIEVGGIAQSGDDWTVIFNSIDDKTPNLVGSFNYESGTLAGAGNVTGIGRCIGIRVFASTLAGSFNINGGDTITIRANTGVDIQPGGQVTAPVVNWVSGTLDVLIIGLS